jgi:hypothetical protein
MNQESSCGLKYKYQLSAKTSWDWIGTTSNGEPDCAIGKICSYGIHIILLMLKKEIKNGLGRVGVWGIIALQVSINNTGLNL